MIGDFERDVVFDGPSNVRDLGGLRTADGRWTRPGRIYRAAGLSSLTDADRVKWAELGIGLVVDLRTLAEREALPDSVESVHVPLLAESSATSSAGAEMATADDGLAFLRGVYHSLVVDAAPEIGAVLELLAMSEGPAVFHCTAGKDRTGVIAALLLDAVGVRRQSIVEDYERSASARREAHVTESMQRMLRRGFPPEAAAGVLGAPAEVIDSVLDLVGDIAGTTERYLVERASMSKDTVELLRWRLLGEAPISETRT